MRMQRPGFASSCLWVIAASVTFTLPAAAQPAPPPPPVLPSPEGPPQPAPLPDETPDPLAESLKPVPGGLTLAAAASRAVGTSPAVALQRAELEAAAGAVDEALVRYFPIVTLGASYTRVSPVENNLDIGPLAAQFGVDVDFPIVVNNYVFSAGLLVPITDYFFRLPQADASARAARDAEELDRRAAELEAAANAQLAVLEWVRAHGHTAVVAMDIEQSAAHVRDAEAAIGVGNVSQADVLELEAQLAQAEHLHRAALAFEKVAEQNVRTILHLGPEERLAIGVDVLSEPPPAETRDLAALQRLGLEQRLELDALDAHERALDDADDVARAGYYPRIDGFADLVYANPNPRVFQSGNTWDLTWDVGVRFTWVVNDTFATIGTTRTTAARVDAVRAQQQQARDAIVAAVTQAHYEGVRAASAIVAAERRENALEKTLEARREQLRVGRIIGSDLIDAETAVTRARLQRIDAHIDALAAQVRLDYATGSTPRAGGVSAASPPATTDR
jgi:outer membrane protein TolC